MIMTQSAAQTVQPSENDQSNTSSGRRPAEKFHDGPVHVSIWENHGTKGAFRTASFEVRYKNEQEQWQSGYSYSTTQLKHLETAAAEARSRIEKWQQENKVRTAEPAVC